MYVIAMINHDLTTVSNGISWIWAFPWSFPEVNEANFYLLVIE